MQVDYALILSAGLGTRMGELGKVLPKVLWPVFSKSLLQLQIDYCQDLGIKNIYINVHYLAEDIKKHVEAIVNNKVNITLLYEDTLLGSGGAIHNLAIQKEINYKGNVLLLNGDQFLFFEKDIFQRALSLLEMPETRASLFGITVNKTAKYNETILENEILKDIQKNLGTKNYITYSGLGIVKLDGLKPVTGVSQFFTSVVNYKNEKTFMITPDSFEYWDFGTAELYSNNIMKIAQNPTAQSEFKNFLDRHNVDYLNFEGFVDLELNSIDLDRNGLFQSGMMKSKLVGQKI
jgi:mannose-1-phosphate guanylyltransferase